MSQNHDPQFEALIRTMAGPLPAEPRSGEATANAAPVEQASHDTQAENAEPTEQPDGEPVAAESVAAEPVAAESAAAESAAAEPVLAAPTATEVSATEVTASEPAAAPTPAPRPSAIPKPSAMPKPGGAPGVAAPVAPAASTEAPLDPALVEAAAAFGRVDGEGTVYVTDGDTERVVGQFPDAPAQEAILLYIRRYLDLQAQVTLFEARLPQLSGKDLDANVANLTDLLAEPAAVGDLAGLRTHMATLTEQATERKRALAAEREASRKEALAERTSLVERAETLAAIDPARVQWKTQGEELRVLLETWKSAQRGGVRIDRKEEDALWKRFAKARGTFDRNRRSHFAELDSQHKEAKQAKEALIARAEAIQNSTDWAGTSAAYRDLMEEWKKSGRAARKEDDALWARFRAAQDVFFEARTADNAATDAEYAANLVVKDAILAEAEALLPVQDLKAAKAALRALQDRWEAAGKVPRDAMQRTEARMRAVEQAVRGAEDAQWRSSNPQMLDRAEGFAAQLRASIQRLEDELTKAQAGGEERKIKKATEALEAQRTFLAQAQRAANEAR